MISLKQCSKPLGALALIFVASMPLFSAMQMSRASDSGHHHNPLPHSNLHSQWREKGEEFSNARDRYFERIRHALFKGLEAKIDKKAANRATASASNPSALKAAGPLSSLDTSDIPDWSRVKDYAEVFEKIRDSRFLNDPDHVDPDTQRGFVRRDSWLYPDDGCFARAALMGQNIQKLGLPRPAKIFIFGRLEARTPNTTSGSVTWWYHVVNIIKVNGQPIVFDPSINPKAPMDLNSWVLSMTTDSSQIQVSVCSPQTYTPDSSCLRGFASSEEAAAVNDQDSFLDNEWNRQQDLGRDPYQVLGHTPPWLN
jgi:hypothetical protein